jgi:diadenosine tetraphosphate (Ap4A) HIT family hydrolase
MITKGEAVFKNSLIRVETEESEVPWLKIFTQVERREFSECTHDEKAAILEALDVIEKEMLSYYRPAKINIASFGNYLPLVHWHIMARFKEDSYFPEPMWGSRQRTSCLELPPFELFCAQVNLKLEKKMQSVSLTD